MLNLLITETYMIEADGKKIKKNEQTRDTPGIREKEGLYFYCTYMK